MLIIAPVQVMSAAVVNLSHMSQSIVLKYKCERSRADWSLVAFYHSALMMRPTRKRRPWGDGLQKQTMASEEGGNPSA